VAEAGRHEAIGAAGACAREREIVSWLQGEETPAASAALAAHVARCAPCRAFADDARSLLQQLALRERRARRTSAARRAAAPRWAAGLAAAVLALLVWRQGAPRDDAPSTPFPPSAPLAPLAQELRAPAALDDASDPLAWIGARLGDDGTWDPSTWRGLRGQAVGMHSFALLALVRGEDEPRSEAHRTQIERAAAWLADQQAADGALGDAPLGSASFDHAVATLALLESWQVTGQPLVRAAAERALDCISGRHAEAGGGRAASPAERAPLAWESLALRRAHELGLLREAQPGLLLAGGPAALPPLAPPLPERLAAGASRSRRSLSVTPGAPEQSVGTLFAASVAVLARAD